MKLVTWCLSLTLCMAFSVSTQAQGKGAIRVVVLPFRGNGGVGVRTHVIKAMRDRPEIQMVRVEEAQTEAKRQKRKLKSAKDFAAVGETIDVQAFVRGRVTRKQGKWIAHIVVRSGRTGNVAAQQTWKRKRLKDLIVVRSTFWGTLGNDVKTTADNAGRPPQKHGSAGPKGSVLAETGGRHGRGDASGVNRQRRELEEERRQLELERKKLELEKQERQLKERQRAAGERQREARGGRREERRQERRRAVAQLDRKPQATETESDWGIVKTEKGWKPAEDANGEGVPTVAPPARSDSTLPRNSFFHFDLAPSLQWRRLTYVDGDANLRSYRNNLANPGTLVGFDSELYPGAPFTRSYARHLGLDLQFDYAVALASEENGERLETTSWDLVLGALLRIPARPFHFKLGVGYAQQKFEVAVNQDQVSLPNMNYHSIRVPVGVDADFGKRATLEAHGAYLAVLTAGQEAQHINGARYFRTGRSHGFEVNTRLVFYPLPAMGLFLGVDWRRYQHKLDPDPSFQQTGGRKAAAGAEDRYIKWNVGLRFRTIPSR